MSVVARTTLGDLQKQRLVNLYKPDSPFQVVNRTEPTGMWNSFKDWWTNGTSSQTYHFDTLRQQYAGTQWATAPDELLQYAVNNGIIDGNTGSFSGLQTQDIGGQKGVYTEQQLSDLYQKTNSDFAKSQKEGFGGLSGLQWAGAGLNLATGLAGMYESHKGRKLAEKNFEEQKALNHANYKASARSFNNTLANQQSGRGYIGMGKTTMRQLANEYQRKRLEEDY